MTGAAWSRSCATSRGGASAAVGKARFGHGDGGVLWDWGNGRRNRHDIRGDSRVLLGNSRGLLGDLCWLTSDNAERVGFSEELCFKVAGCCVL